MNHPAHRSLRSWCVFVACAGGLALFSLQCSSGGLGAIDDAGAHDGNSASCPPTTSPPTPGTACSLANGSICNGYLSAAPGCACCGGGGPSSFSCTNGKWSAQALPSSGQPTATACPATAPAQGSACSSCAAIDCNYDCTTGHGYVSRAQCVNGAWNVSKLLIACESTDAAVIDASDAGLADAADSG